MDILIFGGIVSLTVICPTKGRPASVAAAWESFQATRILPDTKLVFAISENEPIATDDHLLYEGIPLVIVPHREWMNEILQSAVDRVLEGEASPSLLGFIGDDNRFRTEGWDLAVTDTLAGGGYAYAWDLLRNDIPTHVFVTASIVRALGYFGLRGARHLYIDNAWKVLGEGAGCLHYMGDTIIEHLHPFFGKGQMDNVYRDANSEEMYSHDRDVFVSWLQQGADADIQKVRDTLA